MNIIIAGESDIGLHLAESLVNHNHNITIIDADEELLRMAEAHTDLMTIQGDPTSIGVLQRANAHRADLVIGVAHNEQTNLMCCILAKKLGARKVIARVDTMENLSIENRQIYLELGIDALISPEDIAAQEIISLLKQTAATEVFDFSDGMLQLFMIKLDEGAPLLNKSIEEILLQHSKLDFKAVALNRNSRSFIPSSKEVFKPNDLVYLISKPETVNQLVQLGGKEHHFIRNVMIIGGGRVGRITAKLLEKEVNVKVIEQNRERCFYLNDYLDTSLIIHGDATDIQLLEDEDIAQTDAFIAVTNHTETNILTCLHARNQGVKRTIALVENLDYIDISQNIGINTIINKKLIAASYMVRYTMGSGVSSLKFLSGIDANVIELLVRAGSAATRKPIKKLAMPEGAVIGGVVRADSAFIASDDFQIMEGDKVVVLALPDALQKVERLFH